MATERMNRRKFLEAGAQIGAAAMIGSTADAALHPSGVRDKKIRVGLIGCGSVSGRYLPDLAACPYAEVVSLCDIRPERAEKRGDQFKVASRYPHIDKMLAGVPFDLLVVTTDMQEHEHLNRQAIEAGKHVWSEKPIANSLSAGQAILELAHKKRVRLWGAPTAVNSPQFAFMARTLGQGKLGRAACGHASYGHTGPDWSSFFYQKGGGSLPDLGVYNITSLTGLLGPAKAVSAMVTIVTPTRKIQEKGEIIVTEEDNAMILMDHGRGVISHVQSGFNYFNPSGHDGLEEGLKTISFYGSKGNMSLLGYDWAPQSVFLATEAEPKGSRHCEDAQGYVWQNGASTVCECLATGKEPHFTPEHALHVLEIITAARESQRTGRRIPLRSTFKWPLFT
jgi:predicted dehydrogenase